MTVIGIDDTDSRTLGMCTTYVATRLAERIEQEAHVQRTLLVRLNPAVEHKTRGNAALAIHCDLPADEARPLVKRALDRAATDDDRTNPGAVIADCDPDGVPARATTVAERAVRSHLDIAEAEAVIESAGFDALWQGNGRGRIGALAAVGAWAAFDEWTYECISYRERERWGTDRDIDHDSVFAAADAGYPEVWDTVDRVEDVAVCVPRTPCPILHGIRGDDPDAVQRVAEQIEGEPVDRRRTFVTNQGTDAHLQVGTIGDLTAGHSYRVTGTVESAPQTREGGHVFVDVGDGTATIACAAFEPTKRFRDHVRALHVGDEVTVCGEVGDGTLKLEKFAVRNLNRSTLVTPTCPDCKNRMESAGRDVGYRCRDCGTTADGRVEQRVERDIEEGWYEVPPCARRHIARPLVRGGFDGAVHPER